MYLQSFTLTSFKSYPYMSVPLFLFTVVTLLIMKLPNYLRINFAWLNVCLVCTREFAQFEIAHGQMIHLLTPSPHSYTALKSFKSKVKGTMYKINSRGEKLPYWKVRLVHCLTVLSLLILLSMSPCYPKIFLNYFLQLQKPSGISLSIYTALSRILSHTLCRLLQGWCILCRKVLTMKSWALVNLFPLRYPFSSFGGAFSSSQ